MRDSFLSTTRIPILDFKLRCMFLMFSFGIEEEEDSSRFNWLLIICVFASSLSLTGISILTSTPRCIAFLKESIKPMLIWRRKALIEENILNTSCSEEFTRWKARFIDSSGL